MIRNCKVCGCSYNTCYSCEKERSWRLHADIHEHYYILTVLMGYRANHDAKKAYNILRKRGVDFQNTEEFLPSVKTLLAEIYSQVQSAKAPKASVEVKEIKHEEAEKGEQEPPKEHE